MEDSASLVKINSSLNHTGIWQDTISKCLHNKSQLTHRTCFPNFTRLAEATLLLAPQPPILWVMDQAFLQTKAHSPQQLILLILQWSWVNSNNIRETVLWLASSIIYCQNLWKISSCQAKSHKWLPKLLLQFSVKVSWMPPRFLHPFNKCLKPLFLRTRHLTSGWEIRSLICSSNPTTIWLCSNFWIQISTSIRLW